MSDGNSYTEQIRQFGETLDRFNNQLSKLDSSVEKILNALQGTDLGDEGLVYKQRRQEEKLIELRKNHYKKIKDLEKRHDLRIESIESKLSSAKAILTGIAIGSGGAAGTVINLLF